MYIPSLLYMHSHDLSQSACPSVFWLYYGVPVMDMRICKEYISYE